MISMRLCRFIITRQAKNMAATGSRSCFHFLSSSQTRPPTIIRKKATPTRPVSARYCTMWLCTNLDW